jgi:hypothetical protein
MLYIDASVAGVGNFECAVELTVYFPFVCDAREVDVVVFVLVFAELGYFLEGGEACVGIVPVTALFFTVHED